jgi:hypothetical protein
MSSTINLDDAELAAIKRRRAEFRTICAVEGIVFTDEDDELFAMFDRERWPHDRRIAYLKSLAKDAIEAAE